MFTTKYKISSEMPVYYSRIYIILTRRLLSSVKWIFNFSSFAFTPTRSSVFRVKCVNLLKKLYIPLYVYGK